MKSKHKSKVRSSKNKRARRLKTLILPKGPTLKSACRDEIIWTLYSKCRRIKNGKSIKIYLQNVDFPVPINYKTDSLEDLKRKKIIKDYRPEIEETILPPITFKETLEPNLDLLPFISLRDFDKAPKKYTTIDYSEND